MCLVGQYPYKTYVAFARLKAVLVLCDSSVDGQYATVSGGPLRTALDVSAGMYQSTRPNAPFVPGFGYRAAPTPLGMPLLSRYLTVDPNGGTFGVRLVLLGVDT